jgi:geranylgeranyl diphosphate synthase, type I
MQAIAASVPKPAEERLSWLAEVQLQCERRLADALGLPRERVLDARWERALEESRRYALRPAKRLRPALVLVGYGLARDRAAQTIPDSLWSFAAGIELLHTFLLIHDDVADGSAMRRGGPSLHRCLGAGKKGEDLAIVVGDHVFALAIDTMLACDLPATAGVVRDYLAVCRATAAGQYLDLDLTGADLDSVGPAHAVRIALLKTARYGFVAPLCAGARLGDGETSLLRTLERVGRAAGLAFQLRDDLIGIFGDPAAGKPAGDLEARKLTMPVLAAYEKAPPSVRARLAALWRRAAEPSTPGELRALIEEHGGRAETERLVRGAIATARRWLRALPHGGGMRATLEEMVESLGR